MAKTKRKNRGLYGRDSFSFILDASVQLATVRTCAVHLFFITSATEVHSFQKMKVMFVYFKLSGQKWQKMMKMHLKHVLTRLDKFLGIA